MMVFGLVWDGCGVAAPGTLPTFRISTPPNSTSRATHDYLPLESQCLKKCLPYGCDSTMLSELTVGCRAMGCRPLRLAMPRTCPYIPDSQKSQQTQPRWEHFNGNILKTILNITMMYDVLIMITIILQCFYNVMVYPCNIIHGLYIWCFIQFFERHRATYRARFVETRRYRQHRRTWREQVSQTEQWRRRRCWIFALMIIGNGFINLENELNKNGYGRGMVHPEPMQSRTEAKHISACRKQDSFRWQSCHSKCNDTTQERHHAPDVKATRNGSWNSGCSKQKPSTGHTMVVDIRPQDMKATSLRGSRNSGCRTQKPSTGHTMTEDNRTQVMKATSLRGSRKRKRRHFECDSTGHDPPCNRSLRIKDRINLNEDHSRGPPKGHSKSSLSRMVEGRAMNAQRQIQTGEPQRLNKAKEQGNCEPHGEPQRLKESGRNPICMPLTSLLHNLAPWALFAKLNSNEVGPHEHFSDSFCLKETFRTSTERPRPDRLPREIYMELAPRHGFVR